jgi:hypothetical protein
MPQKPCRLARAKSLISLYWKLRKAQKKRLFRQRRRSALLRRQVERLAPQREKINFKSSFHALLSLSDLNASFRGECFGRVDALMALEF